MNVFGAPCQKYLESFLTTLPESIAFAAVNDKGLLGYIWCEKEEQGVRIEDHFLLMTSKLLKASFKSYQKP